MKKSNTLKFIEGAAAGLALGVAASMFLSTKAGKSFKKDIKQVTADFYKYTSPKVKKIKKMGEKEYKEFMKNAAQQYSKAKKLTTATTQQLMKEAEDSWKHFSKHLGR